MQMSIPFKSLPLLKNIPQIVPPFVLSVHLKYTVIWVSNFACGYDKHVSKVASWLIKPFLSVNRKRYTSRMLLIEKGTLHRIQNGTTLYIV